jgi:hypothetical protein
MNELIEANVLLLNQAAALLTDLPAQTYVKTSPLFLNAAIGGHMRHCLEHYHSLLRDLPEGAVDYDRRARDLVLETDVDMARARLQTICEGLAALHAVPASTALRVRMDHGGPEAESCWQASTLGRELQFLISHTVHHFALIAGLCHCHGQEVAKDFGYAPSTLRHRQQLKPA